MHMVHLATSCTDTNVCRRYVSCAGEVLGVEEGSRKGLGLSGLFSIKIEAGVFVF